MYACIVCIHSLSLLSGFSWTIHCGCTRRQLTCKFYWDFWDAISIRNRLARRHLYFKSNKRFERGGINAVSIFHLPCLIIYLFTRA
ncbi:hypothetical protein K438DRAFT_1069212 [Mycena galopus ATCC 62051]|nr:hypothetical protein K438DRAFT_1069212 [Mycena galopus ATCC 62051]